MSEEKYPYGIGIAPKEPLARLILLGYHAPDPRTAVCTAYSVSYSVYASFFMSNIFFLFFFDAFFRLNIIGSILICMTSVLFSFIRFGRDRFYYLKKFSFRVFLQDVFFMPFFMFIVYGAFYLAIFDKIDHTRLNIYMVYVVLHVFVSGLSSICFSHLIMSFLRLYERMKS